MAVNEDFDNGPLADFGVSVTRTPVTTTTDFHGDKTYSDGTPVSITVVFQNPNQNYGLDKSGLTETADAKMFVKSTQTINKYDKITHNSKIYRVDTVSVRKMAGTTAYKTVLLFFTD